MRLPRFVLAVSLAVAAVPAAAAAAPTTSFIVHKDTPTGGMTEVRAANGALLGRHRERGAHRPFASCLDPDYVLSGAAWPEPPSYLVNVDSLASAGVKPRAALRDVRAGHDAWSGRLTSFCPFPRYAPYRQTFAGDTDLGASTALLELDGVNVVEFRSLAGTVCDGAVACVVAWSEEGVLIEADMAVEADLTRLGGDYRWTTGNRTRYDADGGTFSVSDTTTHEWGHFTGLEHVNDSPTLTMYPLIHNGMQTLGLGDMLGLRANYASWRGR